MRWKNRPEGSNWGDFGPDDQRGRMNLLTPAHRLAGVREVTEGIAFTLSLPLDYPGGVSADAAGLNDSNVVVGTWRDSASVHHGFQWDAGTYTAIDVPGATNTFASAINSQNTIAGYSTDSAGSYHGFVLSNGNYTTVDMPGARSTIVFGINNAGMLVGQYTLNGKVHGFLAVPGEK